MLAGHVTSRQKTWYQAIQKRVNYTSEILGSMRNVKMLGLSKQLSKNIQEMREGEMDISRQYRKVQSLNISLGKRYLLYAEKALEADLLGQ